LIAFLSTAMERNRVAADEPNDVQVVCKACGARLKIRQGQPGKVYPCPKCGGPVDLVQPPAPPVLDHVPPPPAPSAAASALNADEHKVVSSTPRNATEGVPYAAFDADEYKILPGVDQPAADSLAYKRYFPVICPLCHTRMTATEDQVGQTLTCPDCRRKVVVPPAPAAPKPRKLWSEDDGVEVQFEAPCERPPVEYVPLHNEDILEVARREAARRELPPLPRRPLTTGVFSFPCHSTVWLRWCAYSIWLAAAIALLYVDISLLRPKPSAVAGALSSMGAILCTLAALIAASTFCVGISGSLLAVVDDTSEGLDEIHNWPDSVFMNFRCCFVIICAFALSAMPGSMIGGALSAATEFGWLAAPLSEAIFFPLVLLSMMADDSPLMPVSLPVWRTLVTSKAAWGVFYVETIVLVGAIFGIVWAVGLLGPAWSAAPSAVVIVGGLLIYFRLLGRLALVGAIQSADEEIFGDDDEATDEREVEVGHAVRAGTATKP
jgi:DNA-directed RNA polymerase subunit RPC12/RpoP